LKSIILFIVILALPLSLYSTEKLEVFTAKVPVSAGQTGKNTVAIQDAFIQMLQRATGESDLNKNPELSAARKNVNDYVVQYGYDREQQGMNFLQVQFDPASVKRLLSEAHIPFWGSHRPVVLCWVVVADGDQTRILSANDQEGMAEQLMTQAARVGLPVILPVMDLKDAEQITSRNIQLNQYDKIKQASLRYHPDAILIAQVNQSDSNDWNSIWHFHFADDYQTWVEKNQSARQMTSAVIDHMLQLLKTNLSSTGVGPLQLTVQLDKVGSVVQLNEAMNYLSHLESVMSVTLIQLQEDSVQLSLQLNGSEQLLMNSLSQGHKMTLLGVGKEGVDLIFIWK
jgi:hypothetical protein